MSGFLGKLYSGTGAFNIVGQRRRWFMITGVLMLICVGSMGIRQFTLGIEFEGGSEISFPVSGSEDTGKVEQVFADSVGRDPVSVQVAGSGGDATYQVRASTLSNDEVASLRTAVLENLHPKDRDGQESAQAISFSDVSSSWGNEITKRMALALVVFLLIVTVYIAIRFERDMAVAALAALVVDMVITAGVYSLIGLEVSPATVIGLLTILGFSLYDKVVVFDKVEENERGLLNTHRRTYAEQANLAVNQTLMRSINTTVISVLPIIALMVIAVWMLGVGTLKDLALIQFVGVIVGAYSSIFFATPLLVVLKQRRRKYRRHTDEVLRRRDKAAVAA